MKKTTMTALLTALRANTLPVNAAEIADEIANELEKNAAKAAANRDLYESAKEIVLAALREIAQPVTARELFDEIADTLPEGFTAGKLTYALSRLWSDAVVKDGTTYTIR